MNLELLNYMKEAFDLISAWDIGEEDFASAVKQQAYLMVGLTRIPLLTALSKIPLVYCMVTYC